MSEYQVHHCMAGRTENANGKGTKCQWQQQWIAPSLQASDMQGEEDGKQPKDASEGDNSRFREEKKPRRDHKPAGPGERSCCATTPPGITHPHADIPLPPWEPSDGYQPPAVSASPFGVPVGTRLMHRLVTQGFQ
jgi:hypothetical protein